MPKKFRRSKVYAIFKDNIWVASLAEMESLFLNIKLVKNFLFAIDIFTKYASVKAVKDKKGKTILNAVMEIVSESNHKLNKLLVDQEREF